jgi:hypothetical protein
MGFFSYNCRGCGHPLLSHYALGENNGWMNKAVALRPGGGGGGVIVADGSYDGYGRINGPLGEFDMGFPNQCDVYHKACFELLGRPAYEGPAEDARDQGYFFDEADHNVRVPLKLADIRKARAKADKLAAKAAAFDIKIQAKWDKAKKAEEAKSAKLLGKVKEAVHG